ncbi:MAG: ABC transporter ATP-binding protein [Alphaproteobacteria bacterium]|nr:ABC transporter ATP-binding protein [Alphaproteobacteria bacterium]
MTNAASPEVLARVTGLVKRFGKTAPPALDRVSASIFGGKITGLVGPDGAGKTTLMRLLAGLLLPEEGAIEVLGHDLKRSPTAVQALIGYMPQRFGLYEDLTVAENLDLYAELRGLPRARRAEVYAELLHFTDLGRFTTRLAGQLSGGMKQKLGLACALLQTPRLLLLDEPSVGVDPVSRRELWRMVQALTGQGIGVVWSTAYLDEAEKCDEVHLLNEGKLLFSGKPAELAERVAGRVFLLDGVGGRRRSTLAQILAAPELLDGVVQGSALRLVYRASQDGGGTPTPPPAAGPSARLRPVAPRLEDGFIDLLGGALRTGSALADSLHPLPAQSHPVIEAIGLTKRFGDFTAAEDMRFSIPRGEIFGLLGPNGAGKSTTFKMLCGLLKPSAGEGRVAGFDLLHAGPQARGRLGYMAQKFSLYGDLSARQNLEFFAGVYGLGGGERRARVEEMIAIFDLAAVADQTAKLLPLGFKQRLALACAVMHRPEALFLDEPTSGVDPLTRREFWGHINGLVEMGVTILVTTHFMDEAEYCDRIALIYRGRRIAMGSPEELKRRVAAAERPDPTLEDAFIGLIEASDAERGAA